MRNEAVKGELVTFKNRSHFHHDGVLYHDAKNATTVIHVHGSYGNFYQNDFLRTMASRYARSGINLLAFNLRGHDGLVEGYRNEWDFEYAGGAITPFEDCVEDIQAAVDFATPLCERVVLQGHSMGCDRVLWYALAAKAQYDLVLLSPCDSYRLQSNWIAPETVEAQIARLEQHQYVDGEWDWLPSNEYGLRQADWHYPIPITRKALLSILCGPSLRLLRMDLGKHWFIDTKILVYIGGDDALQTTPREQMFAFLQERVREVNSTRYYPEGDHSLWGCDAEVSDDVALWVLGST